MKVDLKSKIRVIEDFPKEGISFKDITTLLLESESFKQAIDIMQDELKDLDFDYILGPEARGFIMGAPLAYTMNKAFVPIRKEGKLPAETISKTYELEYGTDTLYMHKDSIKKGDKVVLVDDLLATGGTIKALYELLQDIGVEVVKAVFLIELTGLKARDSLKDLDIKSLVQYEF